MMIAHKVDVCRCASPKPMRTQKEKLIHLLGIAPKAGYKNPYAQESHELTHQV